MRDLVGSDLSDKFIATPSDENLKAVFTALMRSSAEDVQKQLNSASIVAAGASVAKAGDCKTGTGVDC